MSHNHHCARCGTALLTSFLGSPPAHEVSDWRETRRHYRLTLKHRHRHRQRSRSMLLVLRRWSLPDEHDLVKKHFLIEHLRGLDRSRKFLTPTAEATATIDMTHTHLIHHLRSSWRHLHEPAAAHLSQLTIAHSESKARNHGSDRTFGLSDTKLPTRISHD